MFKARFFVVFLTLVFSLASLSDSKETVIDTEYFEKIVATYESPTTTSSTKLDEIQSALQKLDQNPSYPYHAYWKAVLTTFSCELKDKGRLIPFCITSHLSEIKSLLKKAHQEYPSYYHYAPARTLGIMYLKMPAFVGGSRKKAKEYLSEAINGAPDFEANKLWLKKVDR